MVVLDNRARPEICTTIDRIYYTRETLCLSKPLEKLWFKLLTLDLRVTRDLWRNRSSLAKRNLFRIVHYKFTKTSSTCDERFSRVGTPNTLERRRKILFQAFLEAVNRFREPTAHLLLY